jgi:peroxiredoxin Q/BCP
MTLADILKLIMKRGRGRMLNVGDRAPGFDVPDHAGKRRKLSDFAGRTVVLWFYPKADTPG